MSWIQTFTGARFDLAAPSADDVHKADVCHALAQTNRYNGHAKWPYNVAQHTRLVVIEACRCVGRENPFVSAEFLRLVGAVAVLHDASEAYLGDVVAPLKRAPFMAGYRRLDHELTRAIEAKFLPPHEAHERSLAASIVKRADLRLLAREAPVLIGPPAAAWELPEPPAEFITEADLAYEPWERSRDLLSAVWDGYCR